MAATRLGKNAIAMTGLAIIVFYVAVIVVAVSPVRTNR